MAKISEKLRNKVLSTLDQQVELGELTIEARDRILEYAENDLDHARAMELETDIGRDIDSAPTHEALASWKDERQSLWTQIKAIKAEERAFNQENAELEVQKQTIAKEMANNINNISHEQRDGFLAQLDIIDSDIEKNVEKLRELTYEKTALGIMYAEAKSQEAQMVGQKWKEACQPVLDTLQHGWENARSYVRDSITFVKDSFTHLNNRRELASQSKDLQMGFIEKYRHEHAMNRARKELEAMHKAEQKLCQAEKKLIEAAQPKKRDLARTAILNRFGRGHSIELPQVQTVEQAAKVLESRGYASDKSALDIYKEAVKNLTTIRDKHEEAARTQLSIVRDAFDQRRENTFRLMHEVQEKLQNSELGRGSHAADAIMQNLDVALQDSFMPAEKVDENVFEYIAKHDEFGSIFIENFNPDEYLTKIEQMIEEEVTMEHTQELDNSELPFHVIEGDQMSFFDEPENGSFEFEEIGEEGPTFA